MGFAGGGLWAALAGWLRARGWVSETISTLLLNYVAILLVNFFVFGPWKDPEGVNYPQTAEFAPGAVLPTLGGTRVHLGLAFAIARRRRVRLRARADALGSRDASDGRQRRGGAARGHSRRPVRGGCSCSWAAAWPASRGWPRCRRSRDGSGPACRPGYGYTGFLVSWMAGGHPLGILAAAFLLAVITAGGDILQMSQAVPGSVVNILMAVILFVVLGRRAAWR